jgi:hypothetical protein
VAASYITGFALSADASNEFSTTPQVTGKVYAAGLQPADAVESHDDVSDMERFLWTLRFARLTSPELWRGVTSEESTPPSRPHRSHGSSSGPM